MTTFTANPAGTSVRRSRRTRAAGIGLWTVRILLAAQFTIGGVLKLTAEASMVTMFDRIGAGQGPRSGCSFRNWPGWPQRPSPCS